MGKTSKKPKIDPDQMFREEREKKSAAYGAAVLIAEDLFGKLDTYGAGDRIAIVDHIVDGVVVLEDGVVDEDATTERATDLKEALADEHVRDFAREIYGGGSPVALLAAVEADAAWFGEGEEDDDE